MSRFTFNQAFLIKDKSFSHKLAQKSYAIYKRIRIGVSSKFPLKDRERYIFEDNRDFIGLSEMPKGYDWKLKSEVDGKIELQYLDLFDFLPKENIDIFKADLQRLLSSNDIPMFSSYTTKEDINRIDKMGRYFEGVAFSNLCDIKIVNNEYLEKYAPQMIISSYNLSATFSMVRYRVYVSKLFNQEFADIFKREYATNSDILRRYDIPWYKPWRFGRVYTDRNAVRKRVIDAKLSKLKWEVYCEIQRYVKVNFGCSKVFPPSFLTYYTNILPDSERKNMQFWDSIGLDSSPDYSQDYNVCVSWDSKNDGCMGEHLTAFCGGNHGDESLPEIAEYSLSEIYGVYMVAQTMIDMAERDLAVYNKEISKAIQSTGITKLLKVRTMVERKLYYSNRFLNDFNGRSIDMGDVQAFYNTNYKPSLTEMNLRNIELRVHKCREKVDRLLKILDDAAEYEISKTNQSLQKWAVIIAVFSLIIAIISLLDLKINVSTAVQKVNEILISINEYLQ